MGLVMWIDLSLKPQLQPAQVGSHLHQYLNICVISSANKACHYPLSCVYNVYIDMRYIDIDMYMRVSL
jgi:hypothetical protein